MGAEEFSNLDDVVHQKSRLGILALLSEARSLEFSQVRQALKLSDGNLGRHLDVLIEAGLVRSEKTRTSDGVRTFVFITPYGLRAIKRERELLRSILS